MKVQIGDFRPSQQDITIVLDVIRSGRISEGDYTREFEKEWAAYIGTEHCVAMNSGTSALMAGLRHRQNHTKPLVVTTPLTYIATSNAILNTEHRPVYGDVNEANLGLRVDEAERLLEQNKGRVGAILVVHLMGFPCPMDRFRKLALQYDVSLIEDCAQAHGTDYKGKRVGTWGDWGIFSFYISHNIQAGEMGCVVTDSEDMNADLRRIKFNGTMPGWPRFIHNEPGYNFKVTEFQTALALVQLQRADAILKKRQKNYRFLYDSLRRLKGLRLWPLKKGNSPLGFPAFIEDGRNREALLQAVEKEGVETRPLYGCIPTQQPAYNHLKETYRGKLPVAEVLGRNAFYLPVHQYLSREDRYRIVDAVKTAWRKTS